MQKTDSELSLCSPACCVEAELRCAPMEPSPNVWECRPITFKYDTRAADNSCASSERPAPLTDPWLDSKTCTFKCVKVTGNKQKGSWKRGDSADSRFYAGRKVNGMTTNREEIPRTKGPNYSKSDANYNFVWPSEPPNYEWRKTRYTDYLPGNNDSDSITSHPASLLNRPTVTRKPNEMVQDPFLSRRRSLPQNSDGLKDHEKSGYKKETAVYTQEKNWYTKKERHEKTDKNSSTIRTKIIDLERAEEDRSELFHGDMDFIIKNPSLFKGQRKKVEYEKPPWNSPAGRRKHPPRKSNQKQRKANGTIEKIGDDNRQRATPADDGVQPTEDSLTLSHKRIVERRSQEQIEDVVNDQSLQRNNSGSVRFADNAANVEANEVLPSQDPEEALPKPDDSGERAAKLEPADISGSRSESAVNSAVKSGSQTGFKSGSLRNREENRGENQGNAAMKIEPADLSGSQSESAVNSAVKSGSGTGEQHGSTKQVLGLGGEDSGKEAVKLEAEELSGQSDSAVNSEVMNGVHNGAQHTSDTTPSKTNPSGENKLDEKQDISAAEQHNDTADHKMRNTEEISAHLIRDADPPSYKEKSDDNMVDENDPERAGKDEDGLSAPPNLVISTDVHDIGKNEDGQTDNVRSQQDKMLSPNRSENDNATLSSTPAQNIGLEVDGGQRTNSTGMGSQRERVYEQEITQEHSSLIVTQSIVKEETLVEESQVIEERNRRSERRQVDEIVTELIDEIEEDPINQERENILETPRNTNLPAGGVEIEEDPISQERETLLESPNNPYSKNLGVSENTPVSHDGTAPMKQLYTDNTDGNSSDHPEEAKMGGGNTKPGKPDEDDDLCGCDDESLASMTSSSTAATPSMKRTPRKSNSSRTLESGKITGDASNKSRSI